MGDLINLAEHIEQARIEDATRKIDEFMDGLRGPRNYILDENKNPVPAKFSEYAKWCSDFEKNMRVALDYVSRGIHVSTVFLGLDHGNYWCDGPPVVFESMVFGGKIDGECIRYHTWDEALIGHHKLVRHVRYVDGDIGYSRSHWRKIRAARVPIFSNIYDIREAGA